MFLVERADGFDRLAGPSLAFPVRDKLVSLGGFAGVQGSISLNEFSELLHRLSRNVQAATISAWCTNTLSQIHDRGCGPDSRP